MINVPHSINEKGISLVEIIVSIFIIALFTVILISDFPKMLRQFALSRASYQLAQDLRKTQDLGLSGVKLVDSTGTPIIVKGYGLYINTNDSANLYVIYADVAGPADASGNRISDQKYSGDLLYPLCSAVNQIAEGPLTSDCVVEMVDITKEDPSLSIDSIINVSPPSYTSINFSPPGPITTVDGILSASSPVGIVFRNTDGVTRAVYINTSGLITVQ
jgi:type II secretory pathway pseudopilin PulG